MLRKKKSKLKFVGTLLVITYLSVHLWFLAFQRDIIYHPKPLGDRTPRDFGRDYEEVNIKAIDGGEIFAWWVAAGKSDSPTLLYLHGNNASLSNYGEVANIFASYGWDVLLIDYRGFGRSTAPVHGLSEESLVSDAKSALNWLEQHKVDQRRIIIWGHSLGAPIAASLAKDSNVAALILEGSFTSAFDMGRLRYPWVYLPRMLILDRLDTEEYVKQVSASVLVAHASRDRIVPINLGRKVFEAAKPPKEFLEIVDVGHDDFPSVHLKYKERLTAFVNQAIDRSIGGHAAGDQSSLTDPDESSHKP